MKKLLDNGQIFLKLCKPYSVGVTMAQKNRRVSVNANFFCASRSQKIKESADKCSDGDVEERLENLQRSPL